MARRYTHRPRGGMAVPVQTITKRADVRVELAPANQFKFGDPEPVNKTSWITYLGTFADLHGVYYVPPIDRTGLAMMTKMNPQHGSCMVFRANMLANAYLGGAISGEDIENSGTDVLTFGESYFLIIRNAFRHIIGLRHIPAINMRVKTKGAGYRLLLPESHLNEKQYIDFAPDEIIHIKKYDTVQQIYGMPDWLGGLQAAMLNTDATLFRRRYYLNGCHLGFILYSNDPKLNPKLEKAIAEQISQGKGVGNFRTAYFHIPGGNEKAFQVIPIGDVSRKDDFMNIKAVSANDMREAHRVPPILMGVVPQNAGSLGDIEKTRKAYIQTEVRAMARLYTNINKHLPRPIQVQFINFDENNTEG